jgi:hypothetical protein
VPLEADAGAGVSVENAIDFAGFPVVAVDFAPLVAADQKLAVIAEVQGARIACAVVAGELLGPESSEVAALVLIDNDLIVGGLTGKVLSRRMHGGGGDRVHLGFGNVPCDHWHAVLPDKQFLVVGGTDEFVLLDEC